MHPMVAAFGLVCALMKTGTGGRMNTASPHGCGFVRKAPLVTLAVLLAASVYSVSQDQRQTTNAERENDNIKQLISMYAKAADEADPALASRVWCDSSDDSLINPVGRWHGVEQIMGFYHHEMGDTYSSRT
jgi:hypothetical protein